MTGKAEVGAVRYPQSTDMEKKMQTLDARQIDMVSGGVAKAPSGGDILDAIITGLAAYGYGLLLSAVGFEGGTLALTSGVAVFTAHELPALPPPPNGQAFYVYKL